MSSSTGTDTTQLTLEQEMQYAIDAGYPLQTPPTGVVSNFETGDTTAYQLYITAGVCITLVVVFSLLRLLSAIRFAPKTFLIDESEFSFLFVPLRSERC